MDWSRVLHESRQKKALKEECSVLSKMLTQLFDFQQFEQNPRLARLAAETGRRFGYGQDQSALSEDDLDGLSAAGDAATDLMGTQHHGR